MRRLLPPYAYGPDPDAGNYWRTTSTLPNCPPISGDTTCDIAIIGAGLCGLSAALHLAESGADVAVLDAGQPGWGASGRNGGFCSLGGSALDDVQIEARYGPAAAQDYADTERAAVDLVAATLDRFSIDVDRHSSGETMVAHSPARQADLTAFADRIKHRYGLDCAMLDSEGMTARGMTATGLHGAATSPIGFALNPLKYTHGLARAVTGFGGAIHGNSPVSRIGRDATGRFLLSTPHGTLHARKLLVTTNAYGSDNLPEWLRGRYLLGQSHILITRPLSAEEITAQGWASGQMCYDTRNFLHYFRLMPNGRFLFGTRGRGAVSAENSAHARQNARRDFAQMFPAWAQVDTPHFWSGLLCFSRKRAPYVGPIDGAEGAYAALAFHGNGVAMGSYAGAALADLVLGRAVQTPLPAVLRAPLRRFPLGRWRQVLLSGVDRLHAVQDQR